MMGLRKSCLILLLTNVLFVSSRSEAAKKPLPPLLLVACADQLSDPHQKIKILKHYHNAVVDELNWPWEILKKIRKKNTFDAFSLSQILEFTFTKPPIELVFNSMGFEIRQHTQILNIILSQNGWLLTLRGVPHPILLSNVTRAKALKLIDMSLVPAVLNRLREAQRAQIRVCFVFYILEGEFGNEDDLTMKGEFGSDPQIMAGYVTQITDSGHFILSFDHHDLSHGITIPTRAVDPISIIFLDQK